MGRWSLRAIGWNFTRLFHDVRQWVELKVGMISSGVGLLLCEPASGAASGQDGSRAREAWRQRDSGEVPSSVAHSKPDAFDWAECATQARRACPVRSGRQVASPQSPSKFGHPGQETVIYFRRTAFSLFSREAWASGRFGIVPATGTAGFHASAVGTDGA